MGDYRFVGCTDYGLWAAKALADWLYAYLVVFGMVGAEIEMETEVAVEME